MIIYIYLMFIFKITADIANINKDPTKDIFLILKTIITFGLYNIFIIFYNDYILSKS